MNGLLVMKDSSAGMSGEAREAMEHYEAIETMASERYLLDELTPEVRDAYEEHMFGCTECANDVRFGAAFMDHAKAALTGQAPAPAPVCHPVRNVAADTVRKPVRDSVRKLDWFAWLRPAIMVPAFACLLALVGYQNLVTYPALQAAATEPRLLPAGTVLHGATRSGLPIINADLVTGTTLTLPLPQNASYAAYKFDFYDSKNKLIWTQTMNSAGQADDTATIWLPGRVKQDSYRLTTSGVTAAGDNVPLQEQFFELRVKK